MQSAALGNFRDTRGISSGPSICGSLQEVERPLAKLEVGRVSQASDQAFFFSMSAGFRASPKKERLVVG